MSVPQILLDPSGKLAIHHVLDQGCRAAAVAELSAVADLWPQAFRVYQAAILGLTQAAGLSQPPVIAAEVLVKHAGHGAELNGGAST